MTNDRDMRLPIRLLLIVCVSLGLSTAQTARTSEPQQLRPWMDRSLSADARAELAVKELTLDEKLNLVHGEGMRGWGPPLPNAHLGNGGAGFVLGIPRLGIPFIQMSDAAYGVRASAENGRYSTALPSNVALAATWDTEAGCEYGTLIGRELRAQGYNMSLGGGVNLARELRNGRSFEYQGEDPLLAGTMVGNRIKCEQAQNVIGDIKHYALNDQESGRKLVNVIIGERAMRESDLLAFEIGIAIGEPGAVMCSYNAVNGDYACESKHLLTDILRHDWNFKGFVVSDWGGTHSTLKASAAGLDNEQPLDLFYGAKLKQAVQSGQVPMPELDEHARRILRSEFASGIVDDPVEKSVVDVEAGFATARRIAEQSMVLLKNSGNVLPLQRVSIRSVAIIGEQADTGMISGAGSAQVDPPGAKAPQWKDHVWFPTSPLKAVKAQLPKADVRFDSGSNPATAAELAKQADVAIVFAHQWTSEEFDLPNLSLPGTQDALIEQVAAANPRTIVVLESGSAVTMPWLDKVSGVLEAWYAGSKGADAVAAVLFGDVNPSARLPITFPRNERDMPRVQIAVPSPQEKPENVAEPPPPNPAFSINYDEGLKVGYKWYDAEKKPVLFPFGFGLSYTTFTYSDLRVSTGSAMSVSFTVKNSGQRVGADIAQVYASLPPSTGEPPKRLVAWSKVRLNPGESIQVTLPVDPKYLSVYDEAQRGWRLVPGSYTIFVGRSSRDMLQQQEVTIR